MHSSIRSATVKSAAVATVAVILVLPSLASAQAHMDMDHGPAQDASGMAHEMWTRSFRSGWSFMGMAQLFPVVTVGDPGGTEGEPLRRTELYVTQPAIMVNLESPDNKVALRTTLNFEGLTQRDGELTYGGWGEGFLDKRHPHTLLHEFMLSFNAWDVGGGQLSLSAGKGFAPYGTGDPMARPALKYPTNHHLSQILERWTLNGIWLRGGWSLEAGLFGGGEPDGPYDFSNIDSFGDSWSARLIRRWGRRSGPMAEWEASASYGDVTENHGSGPEGTRLLNAALRHASTVGNAPVYALVEASTSDPEDTEGYFSVLGEARLDLRGHQPYVRLELASRPEYARDGGPDTEDFFLYDHDAEPIGATRWLITSVAYAHEVTGYPWSVRPFVEVQHHRATPARGGIQPDVVFGRRSFWAISLGARIFLGGDPMRMGSYGVLDPMTAMHRSAGSMGMPMMD